MQTDLRALIYFVFNSCIQCSLPPQDSAPWLMLSEKVTTGLESGTLLGSPEGKRVLKPCDATMAGVSVEGGDGKGSRDQSCNSPSIFFISIPFALCNLMQSHGQLNTFFVVVVLITYTLPVYFYSVKHPS